MAGDIKPEQLFFVEHLFAVAPGDDRFRARRTCLGRHLAEKGDLAGGAIAMRGGRRCERFIDAGEKLSTLATEKIERAAFHEAFQHFAVGNSRIEPTAEIFERSEISP